MTAAAEHVPRAPSPTLSWRCVAIAAAAAPVHLALAMATDLSPDEAYYLCAAREPGLVPPLVDHPPLVPWLLRVSDLAPALPLELRVRAWSIAFSFATTLAVVALARRLGAAKRGAELVACVSSLAVLPLAGGFLATPDAPAILGVTVAALACVARPRGGRARGIAQLGVVALALAFGALAKVVVLPLAVAFALTSRSAWARVGAVVGPMLAAQFLIPSLHFQLAHAFVQRDAPWSVADAALALVGAVSAQALLWSPWVLAKGARQLANADRDASPVRGAALGLSALVVASALARAVPPEPNWWAPAAVLVLAAAGAGPWTDRARGASLAWLLVPALIATVHALHPVLPLPRASDPTARLHGWRSPADPPLDAPGIGRYGAAAERCVYGSDCVNIHQYFRDFK